MKNFKILLLIFPVLFTQTNAAFSQKTEKDKFYQQSTQHKPSLRNMAAGCQLATASTELNVNNVRTYIYNDGQLWYNRQAPAYGFYEVPKGGGVGCFYAGGIWVGGFDGGNNLKVAAQSYRYDILGGAVVTDFWPGPIDNLGGVSDETCKDFDKIWTVYSSEIDAFVRDAEDGKLNDPVPDNILNWPGRKNPNLDYIGNYNLATFFDADNDGIYNPTNIVTRVDSNTGGTSYWVDHPIYDPAYPDAKPDQMVWSVYNDVGNLHGQSKGNPIGLEVHLTAFAFATNDEVNNMSFYRYQIINRATSDLDSVFMAQWCDTDLGAYDDDYIGCDTSRSMGVLYNGDAADGPGGPNGKNYGNQPPLVGVDFFQGPQNELGIQLPMSSFTYANYSPGPQGQPVNAAQFYGYMTGTWADGTPFTCGGDGHGGTAPCKYIYPGDPSKTNEWSECNPIPNTSQNPPGDRQFTLSSGPFKLKPGAVNEIVTGVVWVRPPQGAYPCPNFDLVRRADDLAQVLFDNHFQLIQGPPAPGLEIVELDRQLVLSINNTAATENYYKVDQKLSFSLQSIGSKDSFYIFQGYKIYQLKDASITNADLQGSADISSKAKLLFTLDIKDTITSLTNYEKNAETGDYDGEVMFKGDNKGIPHTFLLVNDEFAVGDRNFVNYKSYYFMVVPFAYNRFRKFDPTQPDSLGQLREYLEGTPSYINGIPHKSFTNLMSGYGEGFEVTRTEGQGNGGNTIQLSSESVEEILNSPTSSANQLKYKKGLGPIDVKVYNPLTVVTADFELFILDSVANGILDSGAYWRLVNKTTGENVYSLRTINENNEQVIPQWGLSVSFNPAFSPGGDPQNGNGILFSSIEYDDPDKQWFEGVMDNDVESYPVPNSSGSFLFDWIKSGSSSGDYDNSSKYLDPGEYFEKIVNGTWAPFRMATRAPAVPHGPALIDTTYAPPLSELASVEVTLTPDKSKWTKCVVVETGFSSDVPFLNMRSHYSVDKDGNDDGTGSIGKGWFPGYAINLETGERLNIIFGENSSDAAQNGNDMIWNPTVAYESDAGISLGGKHYIYILKTKYDEGKEVYDSLAQNNATPTASQKKGICRQIIWVSMAYLKNGYSLAPLSQGLIPNRVTIRLNVSKPYKEFFTTGDSLPKYNFSTAGYEVNNSSEVLKNKLDTINIVPSPYYAYSAYETGQLDNRIRITNLPPKCTITIYTKDGLLVKQITKDSDISFVEWDLKNKKGVPIASGLYVFYIKADGIGEKVLKWFAVMRPLDLDEF